MKKAPPIEKFSEEYDSPTVSAPEHQSFADFLTHDARVPSGGGRHGQYSFTGREALKAVVEVIDLILGNIPEGTRTVSLPTNEKELPLATSLSPQRGEGLRVRGETTPSASVCSLSRKSKVKTPQRPILSDAELSLAGGAQFGKTILELNLAAYCTSQLFRNFGLYLPDDDLVEGIVDSKFRPDVVDQIGWFAQMAQVGKALNKSGKAVNRKGAFLVTDGARKAVGMIRGLGKVPTTFSMDIAMMDEVDDIEPKMMKFVRGRLTASDLRFIMKIGTQRVHGRGMNKAWKEGSQGVFLFKCPACGKAHNAEEEFPSIVRLKFTNDDLRFANESQSRLTSAAATATDDLAHPTASSLSPMPGHSFSEDRSRGEGLRVRGESKKGAPNDNRPFNFQPSTCNPILTWSGQFESNDGRKWEHKPENIYYLGCVSCGAELDRTKPIVEHRQAERIKQRHWSFRISQLSIAAIGLQQIVGRFQLAVADPEEMMVFRCDVLGLPQSTSQALTPAIIERARAVEIFDMASRVREGCMGVAGLDMGDRCWFFAREIPGKTDFANHQSKNPLIHQSLRRLLAAEKMSAGDVVGQTIALFHRMGLSALLVDERPLVNEARTLALALNGLQDLTAWPRVPDARAAHLTLPGGLTWDGRNSRWLNLKCAVVRFTKNKLGAGIQQSIVFFEEGGQTKFVPCIECNRFETIDRVVREFLTPEEGVIEVADAVYTLSENQAHPTASSLSPMPGHSFSEDRSRGEGTRVRGENGDKATIRQTPMMLLPRMGAGHPGILDTVEAHLITGSEREKLPDGSLGDYVDGCDNHFLLADGYSKLAEIICTTNNRREKFEYERVDLKRAPRGTI